MIEVKVAADLFAGLGGLTEAAERLGIHVAVAANHSAIAVKYHAANHPKTRHIHRDLSPGSVDYSEWARPDLVMASPACPGHSPASTGGRAGRGKRRGSSSKHDRDRSTAWSVVECAEVLRPPVIFVENVPEMMLVWKCYRAWKLALEDLGYHVQELVLETADHRVPQMRDRFFAVATLDPLPPIVVPKQPWIPVSEVVDLRSGAWQRVKWAADGVRQRCTRARERGFPEGPFITHNTTDHSGRSIGRPLGTVTTVAGHWGVVRPGPKGDEYRLLSIDELRACCGFRRDYKLPREAKHATKLLGNAVPPPLGEDALAQIVRAA